MADNNYGNRSAAAQISEDDPFAELTRIMGQTQQVEAEPEAVVASDEASDSFDLDLERELLGEFDDDAPVADEAGPVETRFGEDSFAEEPAGPGAYQPAPEIGYASEPADDSPYADRDEWPAAASTETELSSNSDGYWTRQDPVVEDSLDDARYSTSAPADHSDEPVTADDLLADMDMDFDDLESDNQPAIIEPEGYAPQETAGSAASGDVSLEDELEMLLGAGTGAAGTPQAGEFLADEESDLAEAFPEPAQPPQPRFFARANLDAAHDNRDATEIEPDHAAWDEFTHADDRGEAQAPEQSDPFDILAHVGLGGASQAAPSDRFALDPDRDDNSIPAAAVIPVDVDTVDVPEQALAQQDDLQLPDLPAEDDAPANIAGDDLEAEFAYDFPTPGIRSGEISEAATLSGHEDTASATVDDAEGDDFYAAALGVGAGVGTTVHADAGYGDHGQYDDIGTADPANAAYDRPTPAADEARRRTGFMVAGAVLAVAVLGGIGAFALSFGGGEGSDVPVLVKADDEPLKVKPENPGGESTVPNQDSVAYEAASGGAAKGAPQQESLVSAAEEPVNLASRIVDATRLPGVDEEIISDDPIASGKAEDRLDAVASDGEPVIANDIVAVQPRKVRTMIVRPDGTLVAREDAPVEEAVVSTSPASIQPATNPEPAPIVASAEKQGLPLPGLDAPATAKPATEPVAAALPEPAKQPDPVVAAEPVQTAARPADQVTPRTGPILPSRPAEPTEAPLQQQVAQAAPAAAIRTQPVAPATASSEWSMQIASQPSADSAQATYQELARRYGGVLGGRGVNIIRADIPDKGTYFRVRIPTSSRNDGVALCERYKAAGGSCFVSK